MNETKKTAWSIPVYFAGADSMGGTEYFASYEELRQCMTTGAASRVRRQFVWAGRLDVTPDNLVAALNGDIDGAVAYEDITP